MNDGVLSASSVVVGHTPREDDQDHGTHCRDRSDRAASTEVEPAEAQRLADEWLERNRPGARADTPDAFPGYYTLHTLRDGEVEGMLSVHDRTGSVWYHSWHGPFVQMRDDH
jgi:hypothetical protein